MQPKVLLLATLVCAFITGCDNRAFRLDAEVLEFDAAMIRVDAGRSDAGDSDAGNTGNDAGRPPGEEGDACVASEQCAAPLMCVDEVCAAVGGLDQPCRAGGFCDPGLACHDGACMPTIRVRLCHCIYETVTMDPVRLEMQIGSTVLGPSLSDTCSPCVEVPTGSDIPYIIRREGDSTGFLDAGSLNLTTEVPELGFAFSVGGIVPGPVECDRNPTGFCG